MGQRTIKVKPAKEEIEDLEKGIRKFDARRLIATIDYPINKTAIWVRLPGMYKVVYSLFTENIGLARQIRETLDKHGVTIIEEVKN